VLPGPVLGVIAAATCFAACEEAIELVDDLAVDGVADAGDGTDDDQDGGMTDGGAPPPDCVPVGASCRPEDGPDVCCQDDADDDDDDDSDDDDDVARVVCRPSDPMPPVFRCMPVP